MLTVCVYLYVFVCFGVCLALCLPGWLAGYLWYDPRVGIFVCMTIPTSLASR